MATKKRFIDANELEAKMCGLCDEFGTDHLFIDAIVYEIGNAPTVYAVEVVHGRWLLGTSNHCEWMKCSECYHSQTPTGVFVYCPNCGARMDGDG